MTDQDSSRVEHGVLQEQESRDRYESWLVRSISIYVMLMQNRCQLLPVESNNIALQAFSSSVGHEPGVPPVTLGPIREVKCDEIQPSHETQPIPVTTWGTRLHSDPAWDNFTSVYNAWYLAAKPLGGRCGVLWGQVTPSDTPLTERQGRVYTELGKLGSSGSDHPPPRPPARGGGGGGASQIPRGLVELGAGGSGEGLGYVAGRIGLGAGGARLNLGVLVGVGGEGGPKSSSEPLLGSQVYTRIDQLDSRCSTAYRETGKVPEGDLASLVEAWRDLMADSAVIPPTPHWSFLT